MEGYQLLKPLGDRVIIEVQEEVEQTAGSFLLTSASKEKSQTGSIIAVGEGRFLPNGERISLEVEVGQTVMFEKYAGQEVKYDGKDYLIVHEKEIIAIDQ